MCYFFDGKELTYSTSWNLENTESGQQEGLEEYMTRCGYKKSTWGSFENTDHSLWEKEMPFSELSGESPYTKFVMYYSNWTETKMFIIKSFPGLLEIFKMLKINTISTNDGIRFKIVKKSHLNCWTQNPTLHENTLDILPFDEENIIVKFIGNFDTTKERMIAYEERKIERKLNQKK